MTLRETKELELAAARRAVDTGGSPPNLLALYGANAHLLSPYAPSTLHRVLFDLVEEVPCLSS